MRLSSLKQRVFQGFSIDTKRMFTQGNLARESDVYNVVATANLDHTVCYQLRLISESYCVYITIKNALIC